MVGKLVLKEYFEKRGICRYQNFGYIMQGSSFFFRGGPNLS